MMKIHAMVSVTINPDTTDVYTRGVNELNGDIQIEVWTFNTADIKIFRQSDKTVIEAPGTLMDHQFRMSNGDFISFDSAIVAN